MRCASWHLLPSAYAEHRRRSPLRFNEMPESGRRMIATKGPIQVNDISALPEYVEQRNPAVVAAAELGGIRTILNVPMLKGRRTRRCVHRLTPGSPTLH